MDRPKGNKLSQELSQMAQLCSDPQCTWSDLTQKLSGRGHALLTLLLGLPFLLPIPLPGLSLLFGVIIVLAAVALIGSTTPWLPKTLRERQIPQAFMVKILEKSAGFIRILERWIRPRWISSSTNERLRPLHGMGILIAGMVLALPLPPGTNFPPALTCVCLSIAILEDDGLAMLIGYFFLSLLIGIAVLVLILGFEGAQRLLHLV